jgi:hypothetical protein
VPQVPGQPVTAPVPALPVQAQPETTTTQSLATPGVLGAQQAASAAAAAAAAAAASARAAAAGAPPAPPTAPHGTLYGPGTFTESRPQAGRGQGRELPRLRIGYHMASETALSEFTMSAAGTGVVLGHDRDQRMVSVRLFRPEPTRATVVGGQWLSTVILLRALALGARVAIMSAQPEYWEGFGAWATGRGDRVAVLPVDRPVIPPASAAEPGLLLWDAGLLGPATPLALGPWQTQLTMLRQLTAYGTPSLQDASVVIMQRLAEAEAEVAASVLLLDEATKRLFQVLGDDMVAMLGGQTNRYVWITPTTAEQRFLGAPRR